MKKIAYFSNTASSLYGFRKELMVSMKKDKGFEIFAVATAESREIIDKIEKLGIRFINIPLKRGFDFLGRDLIYFFKVFFLCKKEKFFICHNFSIKSYVLATLAQKLAGVKNIYCTICGLGYTFEKKGLLNKFVILLYKISFKFVTTTIFLQTDDRKVFLDNNILPKEKTVVIRSEGVNVNYFKKENVSKGKSLELKRKLNLKPIVVTLISRILYQKGIGEFIEAAKFFKNKYNNLDFLLIGPIDEGNPGRILEEQINRWASEDKIKYLGRRNDIREILSVTDIFVLPSYYKEGVPLVLLEAGAMEKPLITTNVPGCKEMVRGNENGFLVEPKSSQQLIDKIEVLINNKELRKSFGKRSREIIKENFNVDDVVRKIIKSYDLE